MPAPDYGIECQLASSAEFAYGVEVSRLRETKRAATAQAIVDASMRLVADRRFADVSVDEIAAAAGISRRTFFRYFPQKEDVILDRRRLDRRYVEAAMATRLAGEDEVGQLMRVIIEVQRRGFAIFRPEHQAPLHRLTHEEPELTARSWLLLEDIRSLLVAGLVGARPARPELLRARVLVSACLMVVDAGITTWIEGGMREDLAAIFAEGADHVRRGFASGLDN